METSSLVRNSVLHNDKIMIYLIRSTHRKKGCYDGKIGLKLCVQIEPLVCNPKNKFYRIKTHRQKWRNHRSPTLSAVIFKHFTLIHKNYKCDWKRILVDYIWMLK